MSYQGYDKHYDQPGAGGPQKRPGGGLILLLIVLTILAVAGGIWLFREWHGTEAASEGPGLIRQQTGAAADGAASDGTDSRTGAPDDTLPDGADDVLPEVELIRQGEPETETEASRTMVMDVSDVVKQAMPSVVSITSKSVQEVEYFFRGTMEIENESSGSGFILGENDTELLIATNYHVIEGAATLTVCFAAEAEDEDSLLVNAVEKGSEPQYDLAVLAVKLEDIPEAVRVQIQAAELGTSEELLVGEPAIAIGNALGYGQSVTLGIISALNRTLEIEGSENNYIQTDAAINFGNSGGELLNADGQVIGINSAKAAKSGVEGMGYAIPIDEAKPIFKRLMNQTTREKVEAEERGYLAVYVQDISAEAMSLYGIPGGVYVYGVAAGSGAETAGLRSGDIIRTLDGNSVTSVERLEELLESYRQGETVELGILRTVDGQYEEQQLEFTFDPQPETQEAPQQEYDYDDGYRSWPFYW